MPRYHTFSDRPPLQFTAEEEAERDAEEAAEEARAAQQSLKNHLAAAKQLRDCLAGQTTWNGSVFQTRVEDAPNILGSVLRVQAGEWPAQGEPWRLADNSWRVMSGSDIIALFTAAANRKSSAFAAFAADEGLILAGGTSTPNLDALANPPLIQEP